jgi:acyl carrier protein
VTRESIREALIAALAMIAPEADASSLPPEADIREELDIDSMDFLRFITLLHQQLGVEIPEADYPKLFTLHGAEAYLATAVGAA